MSKIWSKCQKILWLGREHARTNMTTPTEFSLRPKYPAETWKRYVRFRFDFMWSKTWFPKVFSPHWRNENKLTNKNKSKKSCRVFFSRILYIKKTRQTNISLDAVLRYLIMFCRQKRAVKLSIMTDFSKINLKVGRHAKDKQTRT